MPEESAIHGAVNAVLLELATLAKLALENLMSQNAKLASQLITQPINPKSMPRCNSPQ